MPGKPIPRNSINVSMRPLNKGMITDFPSDMLPTGAFNLIENANVKQVGIKRRGGFVAFGAAVDYPPIVGMVDLWKTDGTQETIIMDQKFIYRITLTGVVGKYDTYSTGTIETAVAVVTGDTTGWDTADVNPGDVMILDANGSGDGPEEIVILTQADDTTITLVSTPVGTYAAGTDYEIRRAFAVPEGNLLDWTVTNQNKILFTDGVRTLRSYDGADFEEYSSDITEVIDTVLYFADRLWGARVVASSVDYRYRIIWTSTTDLTDFTPAFKSLHAIL